MSSPLDRRGPVAVEPWIPPLYPYYYLAESSHAAQIFPPRPRPRPRPRLGVWARLRGRGRRRGRFGCGCAAPCSSVVSRVIGGTEDARPSRENATFAREYRGNNF